MDAVLDVTINFKKNIPKRETIKHAKKEFVFLYKKMKKKTILFRFH